LVPRRVKEGIKFHWAARKYCAGDRSWARNALTDAYTIELASRVLSSHSSALDVGASIGGFSDHFRSLAPDGQHHAFEPVPASFAKLSERFKDSTNITLHNAAVGRTAGSAEFVVADDTGLSGFKRTEAMLKRTESEGSAIEVRVVALDDVITEHVTFIKVDVEGAELEVFEGARKLLKSDTPWVVFEHTDHANAYAEGGTSAAIFDLAHDVGMSVSTLDFVLGDLPPLDKETFVKARNNAWFDYFVLCPDRPLPQR